MPTARLLFEHVKIVNLLEGAIVLETANGAVKLRAGSAFALGPGRWCRIHPTPQVRMWTTYVDGDFLRVMMSTLLPEPARVKPLLHPYEWDGRPMLNSPGVEVMQRVEPIWRQMSLMRYQDQTPETLSLRSVQLFSQWMSIVTPSMLINDAFVEATLSLSPPIEGRLTTHRQAAPARAAARILRDRMQEPWSSQTLAREVAVSRSHLTRLFNQDLGAPPMRFLTEVRLTEFTRLIEETDTSIETAARAVGWIDARVASAWFARRFGRSPSQHRKTPHPHQGVD